MASASRWDGSRTNEHFQKLVSRVGFPASAPSLAALLAGGTSLSAEQSADSLRIRKDRVAHVLDRGYRMVRSFFVAEAAGILHENRPVAQVSSLPACWIDSNLQSDSADEKAANPAVAQRVGAGAARSCQRCDGCIRRPCGRSREALRGVRFVCRDRSKKHSAVRGCRRLGGAWDREPRALQAEFYPSEKWRHCCGRLRRLHAPRHRSPRQCSLPHAC